MVAADEVIVVTTNDVPGHRIVAVHGDVFGLVVRARDYFSNLGAQLRTVVGGEVGGYTKLLSDSRDAAMARLRAQAAHVGANAVVAARYDTGEIGNLMNEVAAYGTAVRIEPDASVPPVQLVARPRRTAATPGYAVRVAKAGERVCPTASCDAQGLPTPLDRCDLCGAPTVIATGF